MSKDSCFLRFSSCKNHSLCLVKFEWLYCQIKGSMKLKAPGILHLINQSNAVVQAPRVGMECLRTLSESMFFHFIFCVTCVLIVSRFDFRAFACSVCFLVSWSMPGHGLCFCGFLFCTLLIGLTTGVFDFCPSSCMHAGLPVTQLQIYGHMQNCLLHHKRYLLINIPASSPTHLSNRNVHPKLKAETVTLTGYGEPVWHGPGQPWIILYCERSAIWHPQCLNKVEQIMKRHLGVQWISDNHYFCFWNGRSQPSLPPFSTIV